MTQKPEDSRFTDSGIDLHTIDSLLNKADALLSRHKKPAPSPVREEEDIPVLTEIDGDEVETEMPLSEPPQSTATPRTTPPPQPLTKPTPAAITPAEEEAAQLDMTAIVEQLIGLETAISRQVESWFANELPKMLDHELAQLSQRLHEQAFAQMRTALLPKISEHISEHLAKVFSQDDS